MTPTENAWHGVQTLESGLIEATVLTPPASLSSLNQSENRKGAIAFRARLEIPGHPFVLEQDITASPSKGGLILQNNPKGSWPKFSIQLASDSARVSIWSSGNTVNAEIQSTRIRFALERAGMCSLCATEIDVEFKFASIHSSDSEKQKLLYRAKLCRKLKYIEKVFRISFLLPNEISSEQVGVIDRVFRGITEGEFTTRAPDILFEGVLPSSIDLTKPPFNTPGPFSRKVGSKLYLFDKWLDVGTVSVYLEQAELADPRFIERIRKSLNRPLSIHLEVLDNQITHRFERYARQTQKLRMQRLNLFKQELAREEPKELIDLIDESLQDDVTSDEAVQIAVGWTQYNDLPDRYCPQEPELDAGAEQWRVPIYLVYANGEGGPVGEVIIDVKTGVIISHTPIDELRSKGLALAEQILHA